MYHTSEISDMNLTMIECRLLFIVVSIFLTENN